MNKLITLALATSVWLSSGVVAAAEAAAKPSEATAKPADAAKPEAATEAGQAGRQLPPPLPNSLPNNGGGFRPDKETMTREVAPITPDVTREMRRAIDSGREAEAALPRRVPKPVDTKVTVKLTPGAAAPVVRLTEGFNTTLVLADSQGNPWPVDSFVPGDARYVTVTPSKGKEQSPSLTLTPKTSYGITNMTIYLTGKHPVPITVMLIFGYQKEVDQRMDLMVEGKSPLAMPPVIAGMIEPGADLQLFADRLPPSDAKALKVSGGFGEAWLKNDRIYFRSRFPLQSPAWLTSAQSADGATTYEIPTVPVLMVSHNGSQVMVDLDGF